MAIGIVSVSIGQETDKKQRMSPEEKFAKVDTNGDGVVSLTEFSSMKRPKRPQKEGAEQREPKDSQVRFDKIDANGDGNISLEEFAYGKKKKGKKGKKGGKDKANLTDEEKALRKANIGEMNSKLKAADVNGDERLSFAEFSTIEFKKEIDHQEKFNKLDKNGDGYLEKGEMKRKKKKKKKSELETTQS